MNRRNRVRLPQTEAPELGRHGQALLRRLALVHRQQRGAVATAQEFGKGFIRRGDPLLTIHDHNGDAGLLQSQSGLLPDFRQKLTVVVEHQTTGVHHLEFPVTPIPVLISPVAGDPGLVMDDRLATATEAIHQGGLTNIGAPDDGNDRTRHRATLESIFDPTDPRNQIIPPRDTQDAFETARSGGVRLFPCSNSSPAWSSTSPTSA